MTTHPVFPNASTREETPREYIRRVGRSLSCFVVWVVCLFSILAVGLTPSCSSVAPTYDGQVIAATQRLGADADAILAQAKEPFDRHALEVAGLRQRLEQMIKAAKLRGKGNVGVVAQWELIAQPRAKGGHLLGAILDEWQTNAVLEDPLLKHRRKIIKEAFKAIEVVESDRPPGLQERLIMEEVLGSDASAAEADLFPEGNIAIP